jgi:hypothetical protein
MTQFSKLARAFELKVIFEEIADELKLGSKKHLTPDTARWFLRYGRKYNTNTAFQSGEAICREYLDILGDA